jgi:hypothetical protein
MGASADKAYLKRKILFTPPTTKQGLHDWIKLFLKIDVPDGVVCVEEGSTSPMESVWRIYEKALKNDDPDFNRVMVYSAREGYKTLLASVIQCIMMVLFSKEICTLSAIFEQSQKMKKYLWEHLNNPILREFVVGDNKRTLEFCRYQHNSIGDNITEEQWKTLSEVDKNNYTRHFTSNIVLVATKQSCNGQHPNFLCCDELDVMTPAGQLAYEEAKMVPTVHNGKYPITLLVSTRKSQAGLVQREIDEAERTGLKIFHWSILDVTEKCPESRHKSVLQEDGTLKVVQDCPRIPIYRCDDTLEAITEQAFSNLPPDRQKKFIKDEGYKGCLDACRIFAACKGRLVHQNGTGPLMKKIPAVQNTFRAVTPDTAQAQLLCLKPSREGLVYPRMERSLHMLTPPEIAKKITGYDYPANFSKRDLIKLAKSRDCQFYSGMDHGFSHAFAVITAFRDGSRMFIVDAIEVEGFELPQKLALCESRLKPLDSIIYPDTSDPGSNQTFRRHGFKMRDWDKFGGSIISGIEIVRMKLNPQFGDPELYFLAGDSGVENAFIRISRYQWALDTGGKPTEKPNDRDNHSADAMRYLVMNVFAPGGNLIVSNKSQTKFEALPQSTLPVYDPDSAWKQMAQNAGVTTQDEGELLKIGNSGSPKRGIIWSDDD